MTPLCLASTSPRRKYLLSLLGWDFTVQAPCSGETLIKGENPRDAVARLAKEKALSVSGLHPEKIVLGADTVVVLDGEILGKPRSEAESFGMIKRLQGRSHVVLTGLNLSFMEKSLSHIEATRVFFRPLSDEEIQSYLNTGEGLDKAGSYGIQGRGAILVERIEGDYFNVVGLPLYALSVMIGKIGFPLSGQWEASR